MADTSAPPPRIFAPNRRLAARRRALALQARPGAARYLLDDMVEDVLERLAFLRHHPTRALIVGDRTGTLAQALAGPTCAVTAVEPGDSFDEERPYAETGFDLIVNLGALDTVNDLPGALIHLRNALAPGGLILAQFAGAGSLPALREAMLRADGDRPAARMHPMVDVRAGAQLLQRAGFADPVADSRDLAVSFRSLGGLVADLRAQALGAILARSGPALGKAALARAEAAFAALGSEGRTVETFEILGLSGWRK